MATHSARVWTHGRAAAAGYWLAWLATLTFFGGFYALLVPLTRYLGSEGVGLPDWQVGFVLGMFGVAALIARPLSGVAVDRFGARALMLVGAASLAFGALLVPLTADFGALAGLRVLQSIGYVAFTTGGTALVVSLTKSTVRPAANVATAGMAAPVLSTVEDITSVGLVFLAILVPVLVLVAVLVLVWAAVRIVRRRRRKAAA